MVTGRVQRGVLPLGATVELVGVREGVGGQAVVTGIEAFHDEQLEARAGDNVGLLLRGVGRFDVERGLLIAAPGSIAEHGGGEAELFLLTAKEGGRHTPFGTGYMPQFFFGATDVTGTLESRPPDALVMPGDHAQVRFALKRPVGIEAGMRFALREGGRTIGAGVITAVK